MYRRKPLNSGILERFCIALDGVLFSSNRPAITLVVHPDESEWFHCTRIHTIVKNGYLRGGFRLTQAGWREHEMTAITASPDSVIQIIRATVPPQ